MSGTYGPVAGGMGAARAVAPDKARDMRMLENINVRTANVAAALLHLIARTSDMRGRLLGDREPSRVEAVRGGQTPPPSAPAASELDALQSTITSIEIAIESLGVHVASLERI